MSSGGSITAEPPVLEAPPTAGPGARSYANALAFLAPAAFFLGVWVLYPMIYTVARSFFGRTGFGEFVGIDNYKALFENDVILKSIENSAIWVAIVPAIITALGLIFAVLTERVRWAVAFKTVVFMPMAISLFATGVIWHVMYLKDPSQGAINATIGGVRSAFVSSGPIQDAQPSSPAIIGSTSNGFSLKTPLHPGQVAFLGLTGIPPDSMPSSAKQAVAPTATGSEIDGVVWRDFSPGGGTPGKVEPQELGIPGATVALKDSTGKTVQSTKTGDDGVFTFKDVPAGSYTAAVGVLDVLVGVRRRFVARLEADHAVDHHRVHLGVGRLCDGRDRRRPRCDAARRARGGSNRRSHRVAGLPARHRAPPRARLERRLHHDAHQRAQGLRHRGLDRTGIDAVGCVGDRGADVAPVVRRRQRLRARLGDRGLPLHPRDPGAHAERATVPAGGLMADMAIEEQPKSESVAARLGRAFAHGPLHLFLIFVGLAWLVPTIGLFLTSLLSPGDFINNGWWKVFSKPSLATFQNYSDLWNNTDIPHSLITTTEIAIGGTVLPIIVAALAGYALAWVDFPGRDWLFIVVIGLLVVPLQMALIPIFSLYNTFGIFDTVFSLILFHTAFALPFAIFLLRNFFIGIPKDILESARIDGASEAPHLREADPAARPAGDRVARDLPVPLDLERPARRADARDATRSRSRSRSSRSCGSSARTSS